MSAHCMSRRYPTLAAALLLSACGSVDLGPRYSPPPIRMPEPLPAPSAPPGAPETGAQAHPVAPEVPVTQPLPPVTGAAGEPASAPATLVTLTTRLDGASVVPASSSTAVGQLDALYDSNTRLLRWKASWNGLSGPITGVQFHAPADSGQIAPPVMIWPGPFGPRYEGRATLTPQQAGDLVSGRWYVSIDTAQYPRGELRGQLRVVN